MAKQKSIAFPTDEECRWVTNKLLERNPNLFKNIFPTNRRIHSSATRGHLTPADITRVVIGVWLGATRM